MPSTLEVIHDYLPESLHPLATVISLNSLLVLIKTQGGTRLTIPRTVTPEHGLSALIGVDEMKKLTRLYGGGTLSVPRCTKLLTLARDIAILQDRRKRMTYAQLALKYTMTEDGIGKALRRIEPRERQPWLKDLQAALMAT